MLHIRKKTSQESAELEASHMLFGQDVFLGYYLGGQHPFTTHVGRNHPSKPPKYTSTHKKTWVLSSHVVTLEVAIQNFFDWPLSRSVWLLGSWLDLLRQTLHVSEMGHTFQGGRVSTRGVRWQWHVHIIWYATLTTSQYTHVYTKSIDDSIWYVSTKYTVAT